MKLNKKEILELERKLEKEGQIEITEVLYEDLEGNIRVIQEEALEKLEEEGLVTQQKEFENSRIELEAFKGRQSHTAYSQPIGSGFSDSLMESRPKDHTDQASTSGTKTIIIKEQPNITRPFDFLQARMILKAPIILTTEVKLPYHILEIINQKAEINFLNRFVAIQNYLAQQINSQRITVVPIYFRNPEKECKNIQAHHHVYEVNVCPCITDFFHLALQVYNNNINQISKYIFL